VSKSNGKSAPVKRKVGRPSVPVLDAELVAATLAELQGNISATAKRFNVARGSLHALIEKRPSLQQVVRDSREGMKDNAESSLYRAVLAGEAWAVCFFLKTQAKDRGYIERQEIEHQATNRLVIEEEVVTRDRRSQSEGSTSPESAGVPPV
jgi:hypothetical protein